MEGSEQDEADKSLVFISSSSSSFRSLAPTQLKLARQVTMAIAHAPPHTLARYHYARLLLSPLSSSSPPVDTPTLLQLLAKTTGDWFGTMGGPVALAEVDVVLIERAQGRSEGDREAVIRFPAGCVSLSPSCAGPWTSFSAKLTPSIARSATHDLLTALALTPHPAFRLSVLRDAPDLARLSGAAGRGKAGYAAWVKEARERAGREEERGEMQVG